jgi:hypothetical protein
MRILRQIQDLLTLFPAKSVRTGHIRSLTGHGRAYPIFQVCFVLYNVNQSLIFHKTHILLPSILHLISLIVGYFFLEVMTREGHERRSKHREATGASSSSRAPVAQPKKLTKRARPLSLHEDSSLKDSPPHGATPS